MAKETNNETKICKYCQTEIPKKAKVCPQCGKKQSRKGCGTILLVFGIVMALFAFISMMGDDDTDNTDSNNEQTTEIETDDGIVNAGESFEIDGLKITVNNCNLNYTDYDDEYGWYAPEEGMKYVSVSFTCENNDDTDKYVSIYDYDCYADGTLCEQSYNFGSDFVNANLSSGRNVSFETFYVVPENAQEIELEYTENVWTDDKIIIKLQ